MAFSIIVHISDEDPILGEVDELPGLDHVLIRITNPRRLDGKELHYLNPGVAEIIWPLAKINFIELIPSEEDQIIGFVRE